MSITIHVGQCGIEIGHQTLINLQKQLSQCPEESSSVLDNFDSFEGENVSARHLVPNSLLLDTEEKVIAGLSKEVEYKNCVHAFSGSGNNWALGFKGKLFRACP